MDKEFEKMDNRHCHKNGDTFDREADERMSVCSSFTFKHKTTLHWAERKPKFLADWAKQS